MSNTRDEFVEQTKQMEELNHRQKDYYETSEGVLSNTGNLATQTWTWLRNRVANYRVEIGMKKDVRSLFVDWLGDLSGKRVMELGCASGNSMSMRMATEAESYLGVDLSRVGTDRLREKLRAENIDGAEAVSADFLSADFSPEPFDVIYAHGVLHHFEHFEAFLKVLHARLKPEGRVIAFDPLQTALLPRIVRAIYRPFQSDADWEWPFTRRTFTTIEKYFDILALQGTMGAAKWPIMCLPFSRSLAVKLGTPLHQRDMRLAIEQSRHLWRCMNVASHLQRKELS